MQRHATPRIAIPCREKKKGRLPDGSGPQQFEPRGGQVCCSGRSHDLRGSCETTRGASTMPTPPRQGKHSTESNLPEILRPPARCRRPRPRWQPFCLLPHKPSRPQSRQRPEVERGRCRSGGGSFSLHPRRPSLRGGVKSEIILILVSRAASQPPSVSAPACPNSVGSNPLTAR